MVVVQALDLSFCTAQYNTLVWALIFASAQITLGTLMCLLAAIRFVTEALQMYKATKDFYLNHYMNLLVEECMVYFLVYVHVSSFIPFPLSCNQANEELLRIAS